MTRTFIAIPISDDVRASALAAIDRLRGATEDVKWVAAENLHWTLQFLGDLNDAAVADVCQRAIRVAARFVPYELEVRGVGAFPTSERPKIVWLGAGTGADATCALAAALEEELRSLGIRGEVRKFVPHLTLGRVGRRKDQLAGLTRQLTRLAEFDGGRMTVTQIGVFASQLHRHGPEYHLLGRAPLAGGQ